MPFPICITSSTHLESHLVGLEPVKYCFSWQGRCGESGEGGGGLGMDWSP